MLTSFLNHNTMKKIKGEVKKRKIPLVCAKRSVSCVFCEYCKVFNLNQEFGCKPCEDD
jgi:fumarate reductase flavoprotein subunit